MKLFVISRRQVSIAAVCLLLVASVLICLFAIGPQVAATSGKARKIPIYNVEKEEVISLSFDAAWGNEDTQALIDILGKYKIKATFFVVGEWVDKYPESVKALSDAGHEIMNHSNTHPDMATLSLDKMLEEIRACGEKIEKVTGKKPNLFRPPYGSYNNTLIEALESEQYYCIQWDVDSLDWKDPSVDQLVKNVTAKVKPGSICLFHNAAKNTPEALPQIIEALLADGYQFVPISELILKENYVIDHAGVQRPASEVPDLSADAEASDDAEETLSPMNTQPYLGDYYMEYQMEQEAMKQEEALQPVPEE